MRFRQRSTVLLPQPDGPMNAVIVFFLIGIAVSRTALKAAVVELLDVAVDDDVVVWRQRHAAKLAVAAAVVGRMAGCHRDCLLVCWIWLADRLWPIRLAPSTSSTSTSAAAQASSTWF